MPLALAEPPADTGDGEKIRRPHPVPNRIARRLRRSLCRGDDWLLRRPPEPRQGAQPGRGCAAGSGFVVRVGQGGTLGVSSARRASPSFVAHKVSQHAEIATTRKFHGLLASSFYLKTWPTKTTK